MLEAVPANFFSTRFVLRDDGKLVGELDSSMWRESAQLELGEGSYLLYREGLWSGEFIMERNGQVVARAVKPSMWLYNFDVAFGSRTVALRRLSVWRRRFGVFESDKQAGSIYPVGMMTRRANVELPAGWPVVEKSFLFWLAFLMWKRQSQAAGS